jgi:hypothetical protein
MSQHPNHEPASHDKSAFPSTVPSQKEEKPQGKKNPFAQSSIPFSFSIPVLLHRKRKKKNSPSLPRKKGVCTVRTLPRRRRGEKK